MISLRRLSPLSLLVPAMLLFAEVLAVPVPVGSGTITDRKDFIPFRKHVPLSGKVIGVLVSDPLPVLGTEGRTGPKDSLCFGYNGASYRWVYVPVERNALIGTLFVNVGPNGQKKRFENLGMANRETVKQWDIAGAFALVEVEVNAGEGSPADEGFVATKMRQLDGSKDYPFKVNEVLTDLQKRYQEYVRDQARIIDEGMAKAAGEAIKDRKATGPRERNDLMFVTWLPDSERLRVHFRSTITDGEYKYMNGINIDLGPGARRTAVARPGNTAATRLPEGLRYGKQFGIEFGMAYEVSKTGKVERTLTLPVATFQKDVPVPPVFGGSRPATMRTMKR